MIISTTFKFKFYNNANTLKKSLKIYLLLVLIICSFSRYELFFVLNIKVFTYFIYRNLALRRVYYLNI